MSNGSGPGPWSQHDAAIWHTADILAALREGAIARRPTVPSPFPPRWAVDELVLAQAAFELLSHQAVGDGTYAHGNGMFLATGRGGLAMTAGFFAAQAVANKRRRSAAERDAVPRWVVTDRGLLWVSTHGFYLQTPGGLHAWDWGSIDSALLVAPGSLHLQGSSTSGPVSWILVSDWSELVFVLWAWCGTRGTRPSRTAAGCRRAGCSAQPPRASRSRRRSPAGPTGPVGEQSPPDERRTGHPGGTPAANTWVEHPLSTGSW